MRTWFKELAFSTRKQREVIDFTDEIIAAVQDSKIKNGLVTVSLPHATAALVLNEAESGVMQDILDKLEELVPQKAKYQHDRIDDNAHAHLKSALLGSTQTLPVVDGKVVRGTWQNFLVVEQDGPRRRALAIFVMGE